MQIQHPASLKPYHTFAIEQYCDYLLEVSSLDELIDVYSNPALAELPKLVLGKGSNMLFTQPFAGVVIINRLMGKTLTQDDDYYYLHVAGGEDWPQLVKWCVEQGIGGLENLALIPGCAGSAPIQNIGAYGVELKDVCDYVDIVSLEDYSPRRLTADECHFGYRDSIFKHQWYGRCVIVGLGLKLKKNWVAVNSYGPLQSIPAHELTPQRIYDTVCQVRMQKLPDPAQFGNAGSFFKNPVIDTQHFARLQEQFPNIVAYPAGDKVKVAAGWLIEHCQLKGVMIGGAQVHPNQALVLINAAECSAQDVIALAGLVCDRVWETYQISLEHEVRFMGRDAETTLEQVRR
ncbi:UDP-N-acetylmuramate dehydrogenase [Vibrio navarrensis]|nr:UDP-N-acetylmuramate dehydrogenase [Vibrio navarrensis]